jgi:hypothetical protein
MTRETTNTESSDLNPVSTTQSTLQNSTSEIKNTEAGQHDTWQASANHACASPSRVIRTITLKQPAHVRVLDFGGESVKGGGRDKVMASVNVETKSDSGLKRPANDGKEDVEMSEGVKKPKTTERSVILYCICRMGFNQIYCKIQVFIWFEMWSKLAPNTTLNAFCLKTASTKSQLKPILLYVIR